MAFTLRPVAFVCLLFLLSCLLKPISGQVTPAKRGEKTSVVSAVPQYDLNVRLIPEKKRLEVNGTMRLPAANISRTRLLLSLSEQMHDFRVEILEPMACASVARLESQGIHENSIQWQVSPSKPIPAGKAVLLRFSCGGGGQTAMFFSIGTEVSLASAYGTDWYPLVVEGEKKGTGTLRFSMPAGQTVISGGQRQSSEEDATQGIFRFVSNFPTYFSFAAGQYTVVRRDGSLPLSVYLLHPRPNMQPYLEGVARILRVLEQEFGPYPFREFALVEVPRELANQVGFNAGSVAGFVYTNSRAFDAPIEALRGWYGHEFSHQWFPNKVALKTPPGRFMEEAIAEYGGLRVVESLSGEAAAERYRRTGFEGDPIYSALEYFKLVGQGVDQPLANLRSSVEHRNLAYNKGPLVFDMLSREIGRQKFRRILHTITRQYAFRRLTWQELLRAIEKGAGKELGWFYTQWFERVGAPEWNLTWEQNNGKLSGVVTQAAPYYRAMLEVEIQGREGQRLLRTVNVQSARTEFTFPVEFQVTKVLLDPHYLVLHWTPEYHAAADAIRTKQGDR